MVLETAGDSGGELVPVEQRVRELAWYVGSREGCMVALGCGAWRRWLRWIELLGYRQGRLAGGGWVCRWLLGQC